MIPTAVDNGKRDGPAGDSPYHRLNNALSRIIACAESAIDAADNPSQVRALMELIITCAEGATDTGAGLVDEQHPGRSAPHRRQTP